MAWAQAANVDSAEDRCILVCLADHASPTGLHAWPSRSTLAFAACCSVDTIDRRIKALLAQGFIRRGDQRYVAHLRADRRPVVYDLCLPRGRSSAAALDESRGRTMAAPQDAAPLASRGRRMSATGPQNGRHGAAPVRHKEELEEELKERARARGGTRLCPSCDDWHPPAAGCTPPPGGWSAPPAGWLSRAARDEAAALAAAAEERRRLERDTPEGLG